MAASSDGVSGCNLFFIGWGGFKNYKDRTSCCSLSIFFFNSSFGACSWEAFDDLAPGFSVGPIIAFVAADRALEVEALPSFLDFPSCSKFFLCVMYSFFENSVILPSERKVEFAPNHEI